MTDQHGLRLLAESLDLPDIGGSWTDEQWAEHDARVADENARDLAEGRLRHRSHMLAIGWPKRAIDAAMTADRNKPAVEATARWTPDNRSVLVLSGAAGCGKTVAAAWWACAQRTAATFVRATAFASSSRYDRETRDRWLKASALVLDDLGAEYIDAKGSLLTDLDELVDTFYGDRRPLLITTNLEKTAFKARYGERITDRIRECGVWKALTGESMRGKS